MAKFIYTMHCTTLHGETSKFAALFRGENWNHSFTIYLALLPQYQYVILTGRETDRRKRHNSYINIAL